MSKPSHRVPRFEIPVTDLERAAAFHREVLHPVTDLRPFGELALVEDHDGNVVGLYARA